MTGEAKRNTKSSESLKEMYIMYEDFIPTLFLPNKKINVATRHHCFPPAALVAALTYF